MTDWHCPRCRRRVRVYRHLKGAFCACCNMYLRRGRGRNTCYDPDLSRRLDSEPEPDRRVNS